MGPRADDDDAGAEISGRGEDVARVEPTQAGEPDDGRGVGTQEAGETSASQVTDRTTMVGMRIPIGILLEFDRWCAKAGVNRTQAVVSFMRHAAAGETPARSK